MASASAAVSGRMVNEGSLMALPGSALTIWAAQRPLRRGRNAPAGLVRRGRRDRFGAGNRRSLMGLLVDGTWQDRWYDTAKTGGRFERQASSFRHWVTPDGSPGSTGAGGFKAARGRYHLYVSLACPWAHRTLIFRKLKGLEEIVSISVVEPLYGPHCLGV